MNPKFKARKAGPFPNREDGELYELDQRLVKVARSIKVLSTLSWPETRRHAFLEAWRSGRPELPAITNPQLDFTEAKSALTQLMSDCPRQHPAGQYIYQTAESYLTAAMLLESMGTPAFRTLSEALYGSPRDQIGNASHLDLAGSFVQMTDDYASVAESELSPSTLLAATDVAPIIQKRVDEFFGDHKLNVVIDPKLGAKAAAGSERFRLQGNAFYSGGEIEQLIQHEAFVHAATMLNGRRQPILRSMGLGAPRTTETQEGLATMAELITNNMDIGRLRRIALRIIAIDYACQGADFIETFKFFLSSGQSEDDSYHSAVRIFRGGDPRGTHVFTKDVVYLKGLLTVQTFLQKAIQERKFKYPGYLFSGRMTLSDVVTLEPLLESGWIAPPAFMPPWVANRATIATFLAYHSVLNRVNLDGLALEDIGSVTRRAS